MNYTKHPYEFLRFYCLWHWEYLRRNSEFIKDYYALVALMKQKMPNSVINEDNLYFTLTQFLKNESSDKETADAFKNYGKKYKGFYVSPKRGCPLSAIFEAILNNIPLNSLYIKYDLAFLHINFQSREDVFETLGAIMMEPESDLPQKILLEIDVTKPLEGIIDCVTYYYSSALILISEKKKNRIFIQNARDNLTKVIKRFFRVDRGQRYTFDSRPRAVGLWLWDYTQQNKCGSTTAVNALRDAFINKEDEIQPIEKLGYEVNTDDRTFTRLWENTRKCINAMEVLSMSLEKAE